MVVVSVTSTNIAIDVNSNRGIKEKPTVRGLQTFKFFLCIISVMIAWLIDSIFINCGEVARNECLSQK